jgi:hypothetical protein
MQWVMERWWGWREGKELDKRRRGSKGERTKLKRGEV